MSGVVHARLVDDSRYIRESMTSFVPRPSVGPDGRWRSVVGPWEDEYQCDDHPFLGWIPDRDLSSHLRSPSHPTQQMGSRWRPSPNPEHKR